MTEVVKNYKILMDGKVDNKDKNIIVNLGDEFRFHDYRDLITLQSEYIFDDIFKEESPTIDFEKYKFKPNTDLFGIDFYFYSQTISNKTPISYNNTDEPVWYLTDPNYELSSNFNSDDVLNSGLFLNSYFKFDFYLSPISQKNLFSVALPLDGTMLISKTKTKPKVDFHKDSKTELEFIYWLRKPGQIPSSIFTGNTFDLYCLVSFYNSKTGKVTNFKCNDYLPNDPNILNNYTIFDRFFKYELNYNDLTYNISTVSGVPLINNRLKLYSL